MASEQSPHPRFGLLDRIGKGGMGEAFRAQDRLTGQVVALKQVRLPLPTVPALMLRGDAELAPTRAAPAAGSEESPAHAATQAGLPLAEAAEPSSEMQALCVRLRQEFRTLAGGSFHECTDPKMRGPFADFRGRRKAGNAAVRPVASGPESRGQRALCRCRAICLGACARGGPADPDRVGRHSRELHAGRTVPVALS